MNRLWSKICIGILLLLNKIDGLFKFGVIKERLRLSILILIDCLLYLIRIFASAIRHSFYKIWCKIPLVYIWQLFQRDHWRKQKIRHFFNTLFDLDFWLGLDDSCLYWVYDNIERYLSLCRHFAYQLRISPWVIFGQLVLISIDTLNVNLWCVSSGATVL